MSRYSIILPVRNGGEYIKECIASILAQTYSDFQLIVLDNASTDGTLDYVRSINDKRITCYSSPVSLTIDQNWQRIVSVEKNEFMTIIGHDDLLDPDYLTVMDALIRRYPDASLYQSHFRYIDSKGTEIRKCLPMQEVQKPEEVVHNFLSSKMDIMGTGFMMRSRDYDKVGGIPAYPNLLFADMELWIELSRSGYLAVEKQECFSYRKHPGATTSTSTDAKVERAFDQFVDYLEKLKQDPALDTIVRKDSDHLLKEYCQGITHKVLRVKHKDRQTPSVAAIIDRFRDYGRRLKGDDSFNPLDYPAIRAGKLIDSNPVFHSLFLLFKKIFRKPVL